MRPSLAVQPIIAVVPISIAAIAATQGIRTVLIDLDPRAAYRKGVPVLDAYTEIVKQVVR